MKKDKKKICIITPVFNAENLIEDTVLSILDQSNFEEFELSYIVCDGASNDDTLLLLKNFSDRFIKKGIHFEIISEPDKGMYDALAKGFRKAGNNHDIYAYINAGDYYAPYALREISELLNKNTNWVTGLRATYSNKGILVETRLPMGYSVDLIQQGFFGSLLPCIQQESTFWTAELHKTLDLKQLASFRYAGDFYLWSTFSRKSHLQIVRAWLSGFRLHNGQLSEKYLNEYNSELATIAQPKKLLTRFQALYVWVLLKLPIGLQLKLSRNLIEI